MPSRPAVALIVVFWAGTLGAAFHRDIWPRLAASGPPPIAVDLGDEASQLVPVRWDVLHGGRKAGRLISRTTYIDADDTFEFKHKYTDLRFDLALPPARVVFPEVVVTTRVTRDGRLREQGLTGQARVQVARRTPDGGTEYDTLGEADARVEGRVEGGSLTGHGDLDGRLGGERFAVRQPVGPAPVPDGQALGPLQPVNRLGNVRPGQRWTVREVDPLGEALAILLREQGRKYGVALPEPKREPLIATVADDRQAPPGRDDPCWVIEYREGGEVRAKTWVRAADGKVLRQEAFGMGESVALVRDE
ncbi:MAG: hypothetical protein K2X87_03445 [Gemmataceae bacterium]|nr:hypothetical protein [Gemmataceae bacterium]